ncbi:hypothetical protein Pla108_38240 [Botrimarina colliarenosi]|uniref:Uncharacterized protein n=1 Tax=Botrimarina colliarenosi TaxID=2528001 RepID=A0A5C6A2K5_9BACT|nr:hypothetical protein Pla108_38240 [Botrimarina colliarenosi]
MVRLPLSVLLVSDTPPETVEIPPPLAVGPVVLFPLTVLLVSDTLPVPVRIPPPKP